MMIGERDIVDHCFEQYFFEYYDQYCVDCVDPRSLTHLIIQPVCFCHLPF